MTPIRHESPTSIAPGFLAPPELGDDRPPGARDFDFLFGSWRVTNRMLRGRLRGSTDWVEWEATLDVVPILGGLGNVDRFRGGPGDDYFEGVSMRLFDGEQWTIHWVDTGTGTLAPPVHGRFAGQRGVFYGDETQDGRPVRVRWIWTYDAHGTARWEQAYSADEGTSWEVNWVMRFRREPGTSPVGAGSSP